MHSSRKTRAAAPALGILPRTKFPVFGALERLGLVIVANGDQPARPAAPIRRLRRVKRRSA